jgi:phosphosulfolactate synthase
MREWTNPNRSVKPRTNGITMVMDKGLGIQAFEDLLALAADHIDFIKLGFGTLALTPDNIVKQKIALAELYGVLLYPGGTFFEMAYLENKTNMYLDNLKQLGFKWLEISSGVVDYQEWERSSLIQTARKLKFHVITEIGKKQAGTTTELSFLVKQFSADIESGASYVIIEGRETGENIGIYNHKGEVDTSYVQQALQMIDHKKCIWETPQKGQQVKLMELAGCNVNLGNIAPSDVLSVEALRQGLRADTLTLWRKQK